MPDSCCRSVACNRRSHKMSTSLTLMLLLPLIFVLAAPRATAARRSPAGSQELLANSSGNNFNAEEEPLDFEADDDEKLAHNDTKQFAPRFRNNKKMSDFYKRPSGSTLSLNCAALGNPEPNITWYRNESSDWTRSFGNYRRTKWQLTLEDLMPEDSGQYTCKVCNSLGCISYATQVVVGDQVNLMPLPLTRPGNATQVQHNFNADDEALDAEADDDEKSGLEPATAGGAGGGSNNNDTKEFAPYFRNIKKMSEFYTRPSGTTLSLNCPAVGNPEPNITWYRNDSSDWTRSYGNYRKRQWQLTMDDLVPEDSDQYTCKVCNPLGCISYVMHVIVTDRVNHKPILLVRPANLTLVINSSGHMECSYLSDLTSKKAWLFVPCKSVIDCAENRTVIAEDVDRLSFTNVTQEQQGWYTCIESNSLGQSKVQAYLSVVSSLQVNQSSMVRDNAMMAIVITVIILLIILCIIFVVYAVRKMKHEKLVKQRIETVHQWTKKVIIYKPASGGDSSGTMDTMIMPVVRIEKQRTTVLQSGNEPVPFNEYEFPLDSNWELARSQLVLGATLGEGAFGRVVKAEVSNAIVAVKMVKEGHTDDDIASLVREMEVMKIIGRHINIINLLGCCSQSGPLYVIVEYAPHGNLKDFLYKNRPLSKELLDSSQPAPPAPQYVITEKDLIKFAHQIARGMDYLASRRCIHRDLAARNVLVSDDYVLKIADFGLARDIQSTDYYRKNTNGRLPIKWMAPESLQEKFYDSQSDVWSYGILLWEIMTFGAQPYPAIMSAEELYSYLMSGQRMEKPAKCSMNIYILMRQCWHFDASARPPFTEIVEYMDKLLQAKEDYLDVDVANLDTPPSTSDEEEDASDVEQSRYHF